MKMLNYYCLVICILFGKSFCNVGTDVNFYDFSVTDMEGNAVELSNYKGKVSLVVNVASQCGYTDGHYTGLVRLQEQMGITNRFNVLAFPCNQFGAQEPGTPFEIMSFAKERYNVNFPIFAKINVIEEDIPVAWQYLIEKSGFAPNWNFWKYIVDHRGNVVSAHGPWVSIEALEPELKKIMQNCLEDTISEQGQINLEDDQIPPAPEKSGTAPSWNFWKYLVDHNGNVIYNWAPWFDIHSIYHQVHTAVKAAEAAELNPPPPASQFSPPPSPQHAAPGFKREDL